MNKSFIQATAVAALATSAVCAFADMAVAGEMPLTRAEVIAQLDAARAGGTLDAMTGEDSGSFWLSRQTAPSTLSRQQVVAEVREAQRRGDIGALSGEDSGSVWLSQHMPPSATTRQQVLAEVREAQRLGVLGALFGEDSGSIHLARSGWAAPTIYAGPNIGERRAASGDPVEHRG